MLSKANRSVSAALREFKLRRINVTFLVPTETGLAKSILDATLEVREFLAARGIHDYERQKQGPAGKVLLETVLITDGVSHLTRTSLYRPRTKNGDPRIWISGLKNHCGAGDLIAISNVGQTLFAINCSSTKFPAFLDHKDGRVAALRAPEERSQIFDELLMLLQEICSQGYVPTMRAGDTGVGYTLETLLGIPANSSKKPDYKGIELKAARDRKSSKRQSTLFSNVPNWKISRLKSSREVLEERGRYNVDRNRRQLYHEISAKAPNSYGLKLAVDDQMLEQVFIDDSGSVQSDVRWQLDRLKERLVDKHSETVWVSAVTKGRGEKETFWYRSAKHTKGVDPEALALLLAAGDITVHYLISEKANGSVKDKGYLFKTAPNNLDLIFRSLSIHDLEK